MSAQTPSSYTYSILLHAAAAGALFFGAVILKEQKREPAKFIELVAGEGDNYAATEASMLGDPDGMGVDLPTIPAPNVPKIAEIDSSPAPVEPLPPIEPEPVEPTISTRPRISSRPTLPLSVGRSRPSWAIRPNGNRIGWRASRRLKMTRGNCASRH